MKHQNHLTIQPLNFPSREGICKGVITVPVPDLIGLTFAEATKELKAKGLGFGAVVYQTEVDSTVLQSLKIYKQNPSAKSTKGVQNSIQQGKVIDIWLESMINAVDSSKKNIRRRRAG